MVAFRRPKCLKDILVHSDLKTPGPVPDRGCRGCGDRRCKVCDFLIEGTGFKSRVTGRDFVINFKLDCNSDHVVYLLSCAKCEMQYIGSTINKFRTRFKVSGALSDRFSKSREIRAPNPNLFSQTAFLYYLINVYS